MPLPEPAARALALDAAAFDQRGCLSPRVALVQGDAASARAFAVALHVELEALDVRVPRGTLDPDERADAVRWRDATVFAGELWSGTGHAVGLLPFAPAGVALALPPTGRHVLVVAVANLAEARRVIAPLAPLIVTVGTDDVARAATVTPAHARTAELGRMQRPALDGPVDRRTAADAGAVT